MICYWHISGAGKCYYWNVSVTRVLPSQTSLLVQSSGLAAGVLLSSTFSDWGTAICFLSLSAEKSKVYLIWKVESRSGTKITITLHLSAFLYAPRNFAFFVCHHFQNSHLPQHSFWQPAPPEDLGLRMDRGCSFSPLLLPVPALAVGEEGLTRRQHIQSCSADFDAQNKFLWGMGHWVKRPRVGSYSIKAPCCKYKLPGWAGRSGSALTPLPAPLWKGIPRC